MKKNLLSIVTCLAICMFAISCVEDNSAYDPQEKENVNVNKDEDESSTNTDDTLPEGKLVPGIHLVKINVTQPDGQIAERRFKYFMPISIDESRPISLIFEFHGSYSFDAGVTPPDPLEGITNSHTLVQHAIKENCVICFPAGTAEMQSDGSGAVNWQDTQKHLPFFDEMVSYFKSRTPLIDTNRIYSTGQSSGAIFSFALAFYRSEVLAAIAPRAGQMSLTAQTEFPKRAVPIRVFAGENDETVLHSAVISNMTAWAEKIGGYFAADMQLTEDSFEIEGYKKVDTRIWSGGQTDYQIYSLQEEGHGISLYYVLPYAWEFMQSHTLDAKSTSLYVTCDTKEINAQCGETITINFNHTEGADITVTQPKGWTLQRKDKQLILTAPNDYYGAVQRNGSISITAQLNGATFVKKIPFTLKVPKGYFEVGDIYYDSDFNPIGIVFWVNEDNIREARIIGLEELPAPYYTCRFGNFGTDFATPNADDGEINTRLHMEQREKEGLQRSLTTSTSAIVWAATYSYKGTDGWYLPAINELKAMDENLTMLNEKLEQLGGRVITTARTDNFWSSTVTYSDAKYLNYYNFYNHTATARSADFYGSARVVKKVTKQ